MMLWILLVLLYGVLKGVREVGEKLYHRGIVYVYFAFLYHCLAGCEGGYGNGTPVLLLCGGQIVCHLFGMDTELQGIGGDAGEPVRRAGPFQSNVRNAFRSGGAA